jgi:putative CocE/NonD family hydrolase
MRHATLRGQPAWDSTLSVEGPHLLLVAGPRFRVIRVGILATAFVVMCPDVIVRSGLELELVLVLGAGLVRREVIMSLLSWAVARVTKLDKPLSRKVRIERDLKVPMADGVELLADHYAPEGGGGLPVVLIRTPYGRGGRDSQLYGEVFAQRGYQVVVQSCRGTFGSGGNWQPFQTDVEDGVATVQWLRRQPWFGGTIGMFGPSYLGFVQWAVAAECPEEIRALSVQVGSSRPREMIYPGGGFSLRTMLAWTYLVGSQAKGLSDTRIKLARVFKLRGAFGRLPLADTDREVLGEPFPFFHDLLASETEDAPLWEAMDVSHKVAPVTAAVLSVTGWYDIFLTGQLADYERLRQAGRHPHLVVGPWGHTSLGWLGPALRGTLRMFDTELRDIPEQPAEPPVRVHVGGADEWLDLPDWPPPVQTARLHLHTGGGLRDEKPFSSAPDHYRYDPRHPTPAVGGNSDPGFGSHNNRKLEARADVLTYTTNPMPSDIDVVGAVTATLYVRSSLPDTDFFVRLCDVNGRGGKSINVADGILRLSADTGEHHPDGARRITIQLWPTTHRFKRGHRLRVQISSGSHPRYARNLGSGEPLATATTPRVAEQEVFHDPEHPSAITIPVRRPAALAP